MKLEVIKIKPNYLPMLDIIEIKNSIIYSDGSELNLVNINDVRLKKLELDKYIVAIYIEPITDDEGIHYDLSSYPMEKNISLKGTTIFGDIIIIRMIENNFYSLSMNEIDTYIKKLNNEI